MKRYDLLTLTSKAVELYIGALGRNGDGREPPLREIAGGHHVRDDGESAGYEDVAFAFSMTKDIVRIPIELFGPEIVGGPEGNAIVRTSATFLKERRRGVTGRGRSVSQPQAGSSGPCLKWITDHV